ncbi:MAG: trypsin-like peptidase domain-containing protein [Candidatus Marinimicrobia bacterium]|jgi:serine protease Do|nr:trypsin-like peptidase domain-containing protein [Candidatus Neomarinimicrobiota bacterium]MCK9559116.1 trypsin-like peptidase domain-containing protein [Candidatus Neomarinimicrobiota bacterium]
MKKPLSALFLGIIISLSFAQTDTAVQQAISNSRQTAITRAIERVNPAVAGINVTAIQEYVTSPFFNDPLWSMLFPDQIHRRRVKSLGSGVVISADGYVVTNSHVVDGAEEIVVTLMGGKEYKAKLVGIDNVSDIALLKIEGKSFAYAKFGSSDDVMIGEWVVALGNPFGLFSINYKPTATVGIVSGIDLDFGPQQNGRIYQDMIQTDAAINTGNSGGPLVNADGEVIGINTFIFTGSQFSEGSIGIGFAIPVERVKAVVAELKKYGKIDRTLRIGWELQDVDQFLARYLNLPSSTGIIVTRVESGSSAERAGLKVGDVITEINASKIASKEEIYSIIQEKFLKSGDKIRIKFLRGNREMGTQLVLE